MGLPRGTPKKTHRSRIRRKSGGMQSAGRPVRSEPPAAEKTTIHRGHKEVKSEGGADHGSLPAFLKHYTQIIHPKPGRVKGNGAFFPPPRRISEISPAGRPETRQNGFNLNRYALSVYFHPVPGEREHPRGTKNRSPQAPVSSHSKSEDITRTASRETISIPPEQRARRITSPSSPT